MGSRSSSEKQQCRLQASEKPTEQLADGSLPRGSATRGRRSSPGHLWRAEPRHYLPPSEPHRLDPAFGSLGRQTGQGVCKALKTGDSDFVVNCFLPRMCDCTACTLTALPAFETTLKRALHVGESFGCKQRNKAEYPLPRA